MSSPSFSGTATTPGVANRRAIGEFLQKAGGDVEAALARYLSAPAAADGGVLDSMRYTALAPGKRIRPAVLLATAELYGTGRARALPAACAVEFVHASSLILDDLPCMDDAASRRGLRTNHRVHGEATAILAAFGLLNLAYGILAGEGPAAERVRLEIARRLSGALGPEGLIGGQALDLKHASGHVSLDEMERIHSRKTGSLFIASVSLGALLGGAPPEEGAALISFAKNLGLAYQIVDDLLDVTGDPIRTGKPSGADRRGNFVTLAGIDGARRLAEELTDCALQHLAPLGARAALLRGIALELCGRAG
ncbi:MAG TPA: polyprenyl synthetase family protein [Candidatus Polarisedimenticolia bacterium]|nr:polyprenyl synthetase family protein [Candidatus Polarisedimenticolia bacterium]